MHGSTGGDWKRNAPASPRQLPTQPSSWVTKSNNATFFGAWAIWTNPGPEQDDLGDRDSFSPRPEQLVVECKHHPVRWRRVSPG